MERMKEFILSPEEIYYIGKVSGGKYLDYDYIAAMKDIGKRGKIKQQEILDSLERKGYAQEDFLGNLEVEPACIEILQPLYQGMYESELILREEAGESVHYKFHHMENRITSVECRSQEYRIRVQDKEGIERMLSPLLENNVQTEKKEAYIATDQAERSIILKGTHIGKDTCLYFSLKNIPSCPSIPSSDIGNKSFFPDPRVYFIPPSIFTRYKYFSVKIVTT